MKHRPVSEGIGADRVRSRLRKGVRRMRLRAPTALAAIAEMETVLKARIVGLQKRAEADVVTRPRIRSVCRDDHGASLTAQNHVYGSSAQRSRMRLWTLRKNDPRFAIGLRLAHSSQPQAGVLEHPDGGLQVVVANVRHRRWRWRSGHHH